MTEQEDSDHQALRAHTILLVTERDGCRESFVRILRAEGFDVRCMDSAAGCIKAIRSMPRPALIVMDRVLRDGDGWELVRVLKTLSSTAKVPVIALTTDASEKHFMRALFIGCDAILSRHCKPEALLQEIRWLVPSSVGITTN